MAGHAQLKFVMTEFSKTQIRLTGLIYGYLKTHSLLWQTNNKPCIARNDVDGSGRIWVISINYQSSNYAVQLAITGLFSVVFYSC